MDGGGEGFRGVWAGPQGGGAKDRLLVFDEVALVSRAKAAGLKTRCASLMDTLQTGNMLVGFTVRFCN